MSTLLGLLGSAMGEGLPYLLQLFVFFIEKANINAKQKQRILDQAAKMQDQLNTASKITESWQSQASKDRENYKKAKRGQK